MNISEILTHLREKPNKGFNEVFLSNLVDISISAFPIYYLRYLVSEKELDALKEEEFIPESIKFFRQCEDGDISSLIEAITKLGDILGEETQIIFPQKYEE
jgi:hypothetical protein